MPKFACKKRGTGLFFVIQYLSIDSSLNEKLGEYSLSSPINFWPVTNTKNYKFISLNIKDDSVVSDYP